MPKPRNPILVQIDQLSEQLEAIRDKVLRKTGRDPSDPKALGSFHGEIGGKNNDYVDAVRMTFSSPGHFVAAWKAGVLKKAIQRDRFDKYMGGGARQDSAAHVILRYLQDPLVSRYIDLFLERNFYRQHLERTRAKPADALWEVWFGEKNQEYGLFASPRWNGEAWETDVSEIRRAQFEYWTIGHVLETGFVVPGDPRPHKVPTLDALFDLYRNVLVRSTGSAHGKAFASKYEEHVRAAASPDRVPFLIPEFRYSGTPDGEHKYRLDFTVLSAEGNLRLGVELSPWSTHGRVRGKIALRARGGEAAIEAERIAKWEREAAKRNEYFLKFGLTTLTFTDSDLQDVDATFKRLQHFIREHERPSESGPETESKIKAYRFAK